MGPRELSYPPAYVHAAESLSDCMRNAASMWKEIDRNDRMNVQRFLSMGRDLKRAREFCQVGEWTAQLEKSKIPHQRASEAMRAIEAPPDVQASWESIIDAKRWLAEQSRQAKEDTATCGSTGQNGSTTPPLLCRACRTSGNPKKGCKDCAAVNETGGTPTSPPPTGNTLGGKQGSETTTKGNRSSGGKAGNAPKQGEAKWDWKQFEGSFGTLVREVDRLAGAYKAPKESPEAQKVRQLLQQVKDAMKEMHARLAGEK